MTTASRNDGDRAPAEIYIHIPFCVRKCLYCDFLSFPADPGLQERYADALVREIRSCGAPERRIDSIFIGGGTPSVLPPRFLERILLETGRMFSVSPDAEITMEANPGTLSAGALKEYREMGINRLSLGLQSADDGLLRRLGRIHTFRDFEKSWALSREAGFSNLSLDLMFALPGQKEEDWLRTLAAAVSFGPEHISAYSLIIEEGTPFAGMDLPLPDEDEEYRMYDDTAEVLGAAGYHQYEISNYARPGRESRHNTGYWTGKDYLGFGLGAASLWDGRRFSVTRDMKEYLAGSGDPGRIRRDEMILTEKDRMEEFMFLGLRMTEGVRKEEFRRRFAKEIGEVYGEVIRKYVPLGLLEEDTDRVRLTRRGIHVSNTVMSEFLLP